MGMKVEVVNPWREPLVTVESHRMPKRYELVVTGTGKDVRRPGVRFSFEVIDHVPQCREVIVASVEGGREVRSTDLRQIGVEDALEAASASVSTAHKETRDGVTVSVKRAGPLAFDEARKDVQKARRTARRRGPSDAELREAVEVYRSADRAPTQAVANHFEIAHRTASLWIKRAREAGYLPAAVSGKASR